MRFNRYILPTSVCVLGFFILNIWYRNIIHTNDKTGENLLSLTTGYAGANAIIVHGTIYTAIFLSFLVIVLPRLEEPYLVKTGRLKMLHRFEKWITLYSLLCATFFMSAYAIYMIIVLGIDFLGEINYFVGWSIEYLALWIIYQLIGEVYLLLYWLFRSKSRSLLVAFFISVGISATSVVWNYWSPYKILDIFDRLYNVGLQPILYFVEFSIAIVLCYLMHVLNETLALKRDII